MADNPKSLASLADEATERYYKSVSEYRSSEYSANAGYDFRAGWEAAAALRAPSTHKSLADELDAWAVSIGSVYPDQQKLLWRAAAALRAPTIAPTSRSSYESDCCRAAYDAGRDDAAPTITVTEERLVAALKAWDDKWRFRHDRPGARDLCMFAALQAALATPPTEEK